MAGEAFVMVNFKVTPQEQKLIEKHAKKEDMSISDYVRSCVYIDMLHTGDFEALGLLGTRIKKRITERLAPRLKSLGWVREDVPERG